MNSLAWILFVIAVLLLPFAAKYMPKSWTLTLIVLYVIIVMILTGCTPY